MGKVVVKKKALTGRIVSSDNSVVINTEQVALYRLNKYYKNPRKGDVEKTAESLKKNGQFKPIVVNIGSITGRPNEILAGNHTFMGAQKLKWETMLVSWVDVDENAARAIVLADNGASDGSTYDDQILTDLLIEQKDSAGTLIGTTYSDDILGKLVKEQEEDPNSKIDKIEDAPSDDGSIYDFKDHVWFPSEEFYDMPELRADMIPDDLPGPVDVWAGHEVDLERQKQHPEQWWLAQWHAGMRGVNWKQCIAMFYTEDFHFEPVFTKPAENTKKILMLGMRYAIMPNFSINPEWPVATWIWNSYKSHFVARYWQEAGIEVIPDIQYGTDDSALDITLLGIPQNAGVVSAQIQNARGDKQVIRRTARLLKEAEDRLHFKKIIIYGFTDADEVMNRADLSAEIVRVENRSARRRLYLNSGSTINTQKVSSNGGRKKRVVRKGR